MKKYIWLFIISIIYIISCNNNKLKNNKKVISVSILPQKAFVKMIAKDRYDINVIIPPGASPATYEIKPSQLKKLSNSFAYFKIGYIQFEKSWFNKILSVNKNLKVLDCSNGVKLIKKENSIDPHIWLSLNAVKTILKNIKNFLIKYDKTNSEFYKKNYYEAVKKIDNLDIEIKNILKEIKNRDILVYHPAWGYFCKDYNLHQIAIENNGKKPSLKDIKNIIDLAKSKNIKFIILQKQFDTNSAKSIANDINAVVLQIDPLNEDWYNNMRNIAIKIKNGLKK